MTLTSLKLTLKLAPPPVLATKSIELSLSKNTVKFDGKGARITGVGSFDQCDQFPTNKAVFFIYSNGSILSNFTIVQSPKGIHVAEGFKNQIVNVDLKRFVKTPLPMETIKTIKALNIRLSKLQF